MYRIGQEEIDAVANVILNGRMFRVMDPNAPVHEVLDFERDMKAYLNVENYFLLTSGKGALISGLVALGIGPGDEVLVPAYTYIATALAVLAAGAIPVIVDVDDSCTMSPTAVEAAITPNTKAIIPVHMQGMPADMAALCAIAEKHGIYVLEDACQAMGGSFQGKKLGTWGDAGAFSYNYFKNISAGEGGGLTTKSREVYERAYIYHDSSGSPYFGKELENLDEYLHAGSEFRANEITAAILRVQLGRLDGILADLHRSRNALWDRIKDAGYVLGRSNDFQGECGNILRFAFENEATAEKFSKLASAFVPGEQPIHTGKHVCWAWEILFRHKGAFHDKMNPFFMEANQGLRMNYDRDMCPASRKEMARNAYVYIRPEWTEEKIDTIAKGLCDIAKQL